jgi:hypothetical protein
MQPKHRGVNVDSEAYEYRTHCRPDHRAQWPATTASNSLILRNERPDATTQAGRKHQRGPLRDLKLHDDTEVTEGRSI